MKERFAQFSSLFGGALSISRRRGILLISLTLALFAGTLGFGADATMAIAEGQAAPGELVEATVTARFESFGSYSIRPSGNPALRVVAVQAFPVRLNGDSHYEYVWKVVYQALRSGSFELQGGYVEREGDDPQNRVVLPSLSLQIVSYSAETDPDTAQLLGSPQEALMAGPGGFKLILAIAGAVLALVLVWLVLRSRSGTEADSLDPLQEILAGLREELSQNRIPVAKLERFLDEFRANCSPLLIGELERTVYSKGGDSGMLLELLGKEFSR